MGMWGLNNRSALAVGIWTGPVTSPELPEFRVDDRDPANFVWIRWLTVSREEYRGGRTVYVPHYMLLIAWTILLGFLMILRHSRNRRIERRIAQTLSS
jgi:hypothetical protein